MRIAVALALLLSSLSGAVEEKEGHQRSLQLIGMIGKLSVTMQLVIEASGVIEGAYFYDRVKTPIQLKGRLGKNQGAAPEMIVLQLVEYGNPRDPGQETGRFYANPGPEDGFFTGVWQSPDKKRSMQVDLWEEKLRNSPRALDEIKTHADSANQERSNVAEKKEKPTNINTVRAFRCSQDIDGSNEEVSVSYDQFVHPNSHESKINKFVAGNASAPGQLSAKPCPDINRSDYMGDDEESWTIKRLCSHLIQIIHHHAYAHGVHPTFQVETYFLDERTGENLPLERLFLPSGVTKLDQLVKKEFRKNTKEFCEFSFDSLSTHGSVQFTPPDNLEVVFSDMEISSHVCPAVVSMDMKQIRRLIDPKGLLGCLAH